jgi:hypothetical protein
MKGAAISNRDLGIEKSQVGAKILLPKDSVYCFYPVIFKFMKTRTLSLLVLLAPSLLFGAGLSLNESRTKFEGSHYLVKLNEDQLEEVTVVGTLTLTRDQWQEVRKLSPSTPKRIEDIFPCTHNDCTCGMEEETYGVWFKDGTVAVVYRDAPVPFEKLDAESKDKLAKDLSFRMDERGQFYHDSKLIPYSEVKSRVAYLRALPVDKKSEGSFLEIEIPPTCKASDPALAGRLKELQTIAKTVGHGFYVMWDMTGLEDSE